MPDEQRSLTFENIGGLYRPVADEAAYDDQFPSSDESTPTLINLGHLDLTPFIILWPRLTANSPVDRGLKSESRPLLMWWHVNGVTAKWPQRYGDYGVLADKLLRRICDKLYDEGQRELIDILLGVEVPLLPANKPEKSKPIMRARFVTERVEGDYADPENRVPHLDPKVDLPDDIHPLRLTIADKNATNTLYDGAPTRRNMPHNLYLFDPEGTQHFAPFNFEGDRHVLLLEHTQTRQVHRMFNR